MSIKELIKKVPYQKKVRKLLSFSKMAIVAYFHFHREMISALLFKWTVPDDIPDDKDSLKILIKKRAHHVEKFILMPKEHANLGKCDLIAGQLREAIDKWKELEFEKADFLNWAEKMSDEYKTLFKKGNSCPLQGKQIKNTHKNFLQVLRSRRSIRVFLDKDINIELIEQLVEAMSWAPTACNRQGLQYLFIKDIDLKKVVSSTLAGGQQFAHHSPMILLVLADKRDYRYPEERFTPYQDAAAAIQNFLLVANYLGLGACWCSYTSYSSVKEEKYIRRLLNIPDHMLICGAVPFGWPGQNVCMIPRDESNKLYLFDRF